MATGDQGEVKNQRGTDLRPKVKQIFEEYLLLIPGQSDDTLYNIKQEFQDEGAIIDFVDELSRQIGQTELQSVTEVSDLRSQQKAGLLIRSMVKNGCVSMKQILETFTAGVIAEISKSSNSNALEKLKPFLMEVFLEEKNMDWLMKIGTSLTGNSSNEIMWNDFCFKMISGIKAETSEEGVQSLYSETTDKHLINTKGLPWLNCDDCEEPIAVKMDVEEGSVAVASAGGGHSLTAPSPDQSSLKSSAKVDESMKTEIISTPSVEKKAEQAQESHFNQVDLEKKKIEETVKSQELSEAEADSEKKSEVDQFTKVESEMREVEEPQESQPGEVNAEMREVEEPQESQPGEVNAEMRKVEEPQESQPGQVDAEMKKVEEPQESQPGQVDAEMRKVEEPQQSQPGQVNAEMRKVEEPQQSQPGQVDAEMRKVEEPQQSQPGQVDAEMRKVEEPQQSQPGEVNAEMRKVEEPQQSQPTEVDSEMRKVEEPQQSQPGEIDAEMRKVEEPQQSQPGKVDAEIKKVDKPQPSETEAKVVETDESQLSEAFKNLQVDPAPAQKNTEAVDQPVDKYEDDCLADMDSAITAMCEEFTEALLCEFQCDEGTKCKTEGSEYKENVKEIRPVPTMTATKSLIDQQNTAEDSPSDSDSFKTEVKEEEKAAAASQAVELEKASLLESETIRTIPELKTEETAKTNNEIAGKKAEKPITVFDIRIPPSLSDYRCHFTWVANSTNEPFTEEEARTIEKVLTDKFESRDLDAEGTALKYNGLKIFADRATQAFCNIALNKAEVGEIQIAETAEIISKCTAGHCYPEEYTEGLEYVVRGLLMFFLCHRIERFRDEDAKEKLEMMIPSSVPFESLGVKGQVAVKIMEHYFGVHRREKTVERVQVLKDIIFQDKDYFAWYYELYTLFRVRRRETRYQPGEHVGPDEQEKAMILKTAELAPDNPFVLIGLCRCLLEIFGATHRHKTDEPWDNPIQMGKFGTFTTALEVVDFTREMAKKALALHGGSTRINISLAEFFSVILPYHLRDNRFAKECIERALEDNPNSSKTNHRMAAFCLTADRNTDEALKYFKRAVESDPRNFPALADMIQTMMGNIQENAEDLENVFQEHLGNPRWGDEKQGNLYFLFGVFMCMKKDTNAAVENWITAYLKYPDSLKFLKSISYSYNRHRWNRQEISIHGIHSLLKTASTDIARSKEQKAMIKEILEKVDAIVLDENLRNERAAESGRGRGSRGGRGGHGAHWGRGGGDNRGTGGGRGRGGSDNRGTGGGRGRGGSDNRGTGGGRGRGGSDNRGTGDGRGRGSDPSRGARGRGGGSESRGGTSGSDSTRGRGSCRPTEGIFRGRSHGGGAGKV